MYSCKWVHLARGIVCCTPRWIQTPAIVHIIISPPPRQIPSTSAIAAKATASKENEIKKNAHTHTHTLIHSPTHRDTHIGLRNIEFICRIKWESYISSASARFEVVHVRHTNYRKSWRLTVYECVCLNRPHLSFLLVHFCRTQILSSFLFLCDEFGEYVWQYRDQVCVRACAMCVCWSCSQRLKTTKMTNALSK